MARSNVDLNDDFFDELGFAPGVVDLVDRAADQVERRAVASAPVATGEYRDGIHQEEHSTEHRYVKRVVAGSDKSMGVEARTGNLARALRGVRVY
jgi:hypothetical protein